MNAIRVAATPLTWRDPTAGTAGSWESILDEIAGLGFTWMELGPLGVLPEASSMVGPALHERHIRPVGATRFLWLREPGKRQETLAAVERTGRSLQDLGATHLIVIDRPDGDTGPGGAPVPAEVSERGWDQLILSLGEIADMTRSRYGLRLAIHPHFGSAIFRSEELDRLMATFDETVLELCLDTGHALWGGMDSVPLFERYRQRIAFVHLRDAKSRDSTEACLLGEGIFDFRTLIETLRKDGFTGWVTVDQDPLPGRSPRHVTEENIAYLKDVGLQLT